MDEKKRDELLERWRHMIAANNEHAGKTEYLPEEWNARGKADGYRACIADLQHALGLPVDKIPRDQDDRPRNPARYN